MNRFSFILLCFIQFLSADLDIAFGEDDGLAADLKNYFHSYYSALQEGKNKPSAEILNGLKEIIGPSIIPRDRIINIFTTEDPDIAHCWFGSLIRENEGSRIIWTKDIKFKTKICGNLVIGDFFDFSSGHKEAIDAGTKGDTIYYNLDAYKRRAEEIWNFLILSKNEVHRQYDPSKSNRLRKRLYYKSWADLFRTSLDKNSDLTAAKEDFIGTAAKELMENTLYHELGHILAMQYPDDINDVEEEMIAFLTELKYGDLPYESLDVLISSRWHNNLGVHRLASGKILSEFSGYIQSQADKPDKAYKDIALYDARGKTSVSSFYKLKPGQIKEIAEYIYKKKMHLP